MRARMKIVITGGPGAGKTALIELARPTLPAGVGVVQEAAGILFRGGFPRSARETAVRAAQRAIYHVQRELESLAADNQSLVCDRGTLDGLAYWPGDPEELLCAVGTTREAELARYQAVIHLRVPQASAYNHDNPLRVESHAQAVAIDERIAAVWRGHPRFHSVDGARNFLEKMHHAIELLMGELTSRR
jgi:predicted ATPase